MLVAKRRGQIGGHRPGSKGCYKALPDYKDDSEGSTRLDGDTAAHLHTLRPTSTEAEILSGIANARTVTHDLR
jgi:hypothetical protein